MLGPRGGTDTALLGSSDEILQLAEGESDHREALTDGWNVGPL
jgi:hypothetical protein